jgi:fucose permease
MDRSARRAIVLSSASFAVFGTCLTLPGALLPLLVDHFGIRLVEAGTALGAQPGAYLVAVLLASRLIEHLGLSWALAASLATMALGIAGFGLAPSWPLAGLALFVCGLGLGVMEIGVNTVLIDVGGERRTNILNFAHLFFGVGSFAAPLLATHAVGSGYSWRWPYVVAGLLTLAVGTAWVAGRNAAPAAAHPTGAGSTDRIDRMFVALLAAILALYVGVETGVGWWLTKYLTTVRGVSIVEAGNVLALYWLGLTALRLVLTFVAHHARDEHLIVVMALIATVALAVGLLAQSASVTTIAFVVTGMGLSGIFPAIIAVGGRSHPHNVTHVTSILVAGAGTGGIVIPWLMSAVADRASITAGMLFYLGMSAIMVALTITLAAIVPRTSSPNGGSSAARP